MHLDPEVANGVGGGAGWPRSPVPTARLAQVVHSEGRATHRRRDGRAPMRNDPGLASFALSQLAVFAASLVLACTAGSNDDDGPAGSSTDPGSAATSSADASAGSGATTTAGTATTANATDPASTGDGGGEDSSSGVGETDPLPEFRQRYLDECATCHGDDGLGTEDGPEIRHPDPGLAYYYVRNGDANVWIAKSGEAPADHTGIGDDRVMTAFAEVDLPDAIVDEMIAWLQSFPNPEDPGELYADFCAHCHGPGGPVTENIDYVKPGILDMTDWPTLLDKVQHGHTSLDGVAILMDERRRYMPPFAGRLSDEEIASIAGWICEQYTTAPPFCAQLP